MFVKFHIEIIKYHIIVIYFKKIYVCLFNIYCNGWLKSQIFLKIEKLTVKSYVNNYF